MEQITFWARNPKTNADEKLRVSPSQLDRIGLVDPAMGEEKKKTNALPAVVLTGTASAFGELVIFVLMAWTKRITPDLLVDKIYSTQRLFQPRGWVIEPFAFQKALKYWIAARNREGKDGYVNVIDVKPHTRTSKETYIRGLQPYLGHRRIYVAEGMFDLVKQVQRFPLGRPIDLLDALAMGQEVWRKPVEAEEIDREEEWEGRWLSQRNPYTGY